MSKTIAMVAAIAVILVCQINSTQIKEKTNLRKLGFDISIDKTFNIKSFTFLGQKIFYKYRVAVLNGKAMNYLIIETNLGTFKFGNLGADSETKGSWKGKVKLFNLEVKSVKMAIYASGTLEWEIKYIDEAKTKLRMALFGDLESSAELIYTPEDFTKVRSYGKIISTGGFAVATNSGISNGFTFSGEEVDIWVNDDIVYSLFGNWIGY